MASTNGKRLLIAGGGTGGHLFPALAVAESWEAHPAGGAILFVGTADGLESRILPPLGRSLAVLRVGKLKGSGLLRRLRTLLGLPGALWSALKIVREFKPEVVLGVGGFASAPAVVAARLLGIPAALHEQNAHPGLANRQLSRVAQLAMVSFKEAADGWFHCPTELTGNPVRAALVQAANEEPLQEEGCFRVLIFGGSLGARIFTEIVPSALIAVHQQLPPGVRLRIRQQAPSSDVAQVQEAYRQAGVEAETSPFIHNMAKAYQEADLVICRAGATSLAELAIMGKAALLVPFPYAADDHQTANARAAAQAGGGWLQPQQALTVPWLQQFIQERLADPHGVKQAGLNMRQLARPQAAQQIVERLLHMAEQR